MTYNVLSGTLNLLNHCSLVGLWHVLTTHPSGLPTSNTSVRQVIPAVNSQAHGIAALCPLLVSHPAEVGG